MKPPVSSVPLRRRRLPRWVAILGIVIASLPTAAVVLAFPVANHWVHSNWSQFRAEWESRGEIFELEALLSPTPADEENFAKAPLIAECYEQPPSLSQEHSAHDHDHSDHDHDHDHGDAGRFHGRLGKLNLFEAGDLVPPRPKPPLAFLTGQPIDLSLYLPPSSDEAGAAPPLDRARALFAPHEPLIDELMAAAERPSAHYPVNRDNPSASLLSHLPPLIQALHALRIHNLMLVEAGPDSAEDAAAHLANTLRLIRHGTASEGLASYSIRTLALESGGLEVVWQALYRQRFSDAQWMDIDRELRAFEFGPRLLDSLRFERAALIREVENGFDRRSQRPFSVPPAWVRLTGLMEYAELTQRYWFTDGASGRSLTSGPQLPQLAAIEQHVAGLESNFSNFVLAVGVLPVHDFAIRSRWIESQRNHALIAIALERYRLTHGRLPERLGALVPDFLPEIPAQVVTGEPPRLERLPAPDGTDSVEMTSYRLRSFGDETGLGDPIWFMPSAKIR